MDNLELFYEVLSYLLLVFKPLLDYSRDLSRWLLLWVKGLMRTSLSFLSTPVSTDYSSVHILRPFLGQLEIIVWIEKDAWKIGNFFYFKEWSKKGNRDLIKPLIQNQSHDLLWSVVPSNVRYEEPCKGLVPETSLCCCCWEHCDYSLWEESAYLLDMWVRLSASKRSKQRSK